MFLVSKLILKENPDLGKPMQSTFRAKLNRYLRKPYKKYKGNIPGNII